MGLHDMLRQRPEISAEYFNESNGRVSIYTTAKTEGLIAVGSSQFQLLFNAHTIGSITYRSQIPVNEVYHIQLYPRDLGTFEV